MVNTRTKFICKVCIGKYDTIEETYKCCKLQYHLNSDIEFWNPEPTEPKQIFICGNCSREYSNDGKAEGCCLRLIPNGELSPKDHNSLQEQTKELI